MDKFKCNCMDWDPFLMYGEYTISPEQAWTEEYLPGIVKQFQDNTNLNKFLVNDKQELPTKSSVDVGGMVNICNKDRIGNLATMYLGVSLGRNMDALLGYLYDSNQDFVYPDSSGALPSVAPSNVVTTKDTRDEWWGQWFPYINQVYKTILNQFKLRLFATN